MNKKLNSNKLKLIEMKILNAYNTKINNNKNLFIKNQDEIESKLKLDLDMIIKSKDFQQECRKSHNSIKLIEKEDIIFSKQNNILGRNKKKFNVNLLDYIIFYLLCKKRIHFEKYLNFKDIFIKNLDVKEIILSLNEIQKLKFFLLEDNHIKLFEELKYLSEDDMGREKN